MSKNSQINIRLAFTISFQQGCLICFTFPFYRCVDPKEKSLAIGLTIFLISIFAMLPAPILFGAIFGNA